MNLKQEKSNLPQEERDNLLINWDTVTIIDMRNEDEFNSLVEKNKTFKKMK